MEIKKDKTGRTIGKYFHKAPGIECTYTKRQAAKDIAEDCGDGKFYSKVYINEEYLVLKACDCLMTVYNIDTNKL
jgi:hypothetical protein